MRVAVLADTHLRDRDRPTPPHPGGQGRAWRPRDLPAQAWERIAGSDVILHAGDVLDAGTLERLNEMAPTYAVLGNNDVALTGLLPLSRVMDLAGVRVAMIHDAGPRKGRPGRLRRQFPDADIVVFGHSHAPCNEVGLDGQILFNPGSPTARRVQPTRTMGAFDLADGRCVRREIIDLGP
jgi:putative phosphoesterase